jgi:hypothetical protein
MEYSIHQSTYGGSSGDTVLYNLFSISLMEDDSPTCVSYILSFHDTEIEDYNLPPPPPFFH